MFLPIERLIELQCSLEAHILGETELILNRLTPNRTYQLVNFHFDHKSEDEGEVNAWQAGLQDSKRQCHKDECLLSCEDLVMEEADLGFKQVLSLFKSVFDEEGAVSTRLGRNFGWAPVYNTVLRYAALKSNNHTGRGVMQKRRLHTSQGEGLRTSTNSTIERGGNHVDTNKSDNSQRYRLEAGGGSGMGFQVYCDGRMVLTAGGGGGGGIEGPVGNFNFGGGGGGGVQVDRIFAAGGLSGEGLETHEQQDEEEETSAKSGEGDGDDDPFFYRAESTGAGEDVGSGQWASIGGGGGCGTCTPGSDALCDSASGNNLLCDEQADGGDGRIRAQPPPSSSPSFSSPTSSSPFSSSSPPPSSSFSYETTRNEGQKDDIWWDKGEGGAGIDTGTGTDEYSTSNNINTSNDDDDDDPRGKHTVSSHVMAQILRNLTRTLSLPTSCSVIDVAGGGGGGGGTAECCQPFMVGYGFSFHIRSSSLGLSGVVSTPAGSRASNNSTSGGSSGESLATDDSRAEGTPSSSFSSFPADTSSSSASNHPVLVPTYFDLPPGAQRRSCEKKERSSNKINKSSSFSKNKSSEKEIREIGITSDNRNQEHSSPSSASASASDTSTTSVSEWEKKEEKNEEEKDKKVGNKAPRPPAVTTRRPPSHNHYHRRVKRKLMRNIEKTKNTSSKKKTTETQEARGEKSNNRREIKEEEDNDNYYEQEEDTTTKHPAVEVLGVDGRNRQYQFDIAGALIRDGSLQCGGYGNWCCICVHAREQVKRCLSTVAEQSSVNNSVGGYVERYHRNRRGSADGDRDEESSSASGGSNAAAAARYQRTKTTTAMIQQSPISSSTSTSSSSIAKQREEEIVYSHDGGESDHDGDSTDSNEQFQTSVPCVVVVKAKTRVMWLLQANCGCPGDRPQEEEEVEEEGDPESPADGNNDGSDRHVGDASDNEQDSYTWNSYNSNTGRVINSSRDAPPNDAYAWSPAVEQTLEDSYHRDINLIARDKMVSQVKMSRFHQCLAAKQAQYDSLRPQQQWHVSGAGNNSSMDIITNFTATSVMTEGAAPASSAVTLSPSMRSSSGRADDAGSGTATEYQQRRHYNFKNNIVVHDNHDDQAVNSSVNTGPGINIIISSSISSSDEEHYTRGAYNHWWDYSTTLTPSALASNPYLWHNTSSSSSTGTSISCMNMSAYLDAAERYLSAPGYVPFQERLGYNICPNTTTSSYGNSANNSSTLIEGGGGGRGEGGGGGRGGGYSGLLSDDYADLEPGHNSSNTTGSISSELLTAWSPSTSRFGESHNLEWSIVSLFLVVLSTLIVFLSLIRCFVRLQYKKNSSYGFRELPVHSYDDDDIEDTNSDVVRRRSGFVTLKDKDEDEI